MYPWIRDAAAAAAAAAVGFGSPHHNPFHQQMNNHNQQSQHMHSMNGKVENGYHHLHHNQSNLNDCMMALDYVHNKVRQVNLLFSI